MNKYDWSKFPQWVNWAFTDQDGDIFGCDNKPCGMDGFHGDPSKDKWEYLGEGYPIDWQDSLEERPND